VTGLMFVHRILGGLFTPIDQMPGALQFVAHLMAELPPGVAGVGFDRRSHPRAYPLAVLAGCAAVLGLAISGNIGSRRPGPRLMEPASTWKSLRGVLYGWQ